MQDTQEKQPFSGLPLPKFFVWRNGKRQLVPTVVRKQGRTSDGHPYRVTAPGRLTDRTAENTR